MKTTHAQMIYQRLQERGYIFSYEITGELYCQQYNARIYDVRKKLGCICKHGRNLMCPAFEHVVNEKDNKFILIRNQSKEATMGVGYQKFVQRGLELKGQLPEKQESLREKFEKANDWYTSNYEKLTEAARKVAGDKLQVMLEDLELQENAEKVLL